MENIEKPDWIDENGNIFVTRDSCRAVSAFLHNVLIDNPFIDGVMFQSFASVSIYLEAYKDDLD